MLKVYAHRCCTDGFGAAWSAHVARKGRIEPVFIGAGGAHSPTDTEVANRDVVCLDTCFSRDVHVRVSEIASSFMTYDHHKTTWDDLGGLPNLTYDAARSGAGIAWDSLVGTVRPWIIDYVEDADLWKFALPDSRYVREYLYGLPHDFDLWTERAFAADGLSRAVAEGKILEARTVQDVQRALERTYMLRLGEHVVPTVATATHVSAIGAALLNKYPKAKFAIMWTLLPTGRVQLSLRAREGEFSVADYVRVRFGRGGGHDASAGVVLPWETWAGIIDDN